MNHSFRAADMVGGGGAVSKFLAGHLARPEGVSKFSRAPPPTLSAAGLAQKSDAATNREMPFGQNPIGICPLGKSYRKCQ